MTVVAVSDLPRAAMVPPSGLPSQKLVSPPPPQSIALSAPGPGQTGKLNVGASGGWCIVTIDGVARGETPVAGIELSAGPHEVSCAPAEGKVKTATVVIQKDGTTRYRFALEE